MKKFICNVILFSSIIAIIVGLINAAYLWRESENYGTMNYYRNDSAIIKDVPKEIQICNLGSSHGCYGFDYTGLLEQYTCFNFGLPSQTLSYDYRILENYQNNIQKGAIVFIPISHFSFFGNDETANDSFYSKNKRYYKFLSNEYVKEYDLKTDILVTYLPSLTVENAFTLGKNILVGINDEDVWNVETNVEAAQKHAVMRYESFIESKKDDGGNRIFNANEIAALYSIISLCKENGYVPILITTPYLDEYNGQVRANDPEFYDDFYAIIYEIVESTGVAYLDYSEDERFTYDYTLFFNTDHLNHNGATLFVSILYNEVIKDIIINEYSCAEAGLFNQLGIS